MSRSDSPGEPSAKAAPLQVRSATRRAMLIGCAASAGACAADMRAPTPRTHIYSPHGLTLEAYPASGARTPAVLLLHGGGWYGGAPADIAPLAARLSQNGVRAINLQYRLTADGARWPQPLEDVRAAIWWVRDNAGALDIDPYQIIGLGYSAGGHLAACCAVAEAIGPSGASGRLNKLITLAAPWDLTTLNPARHEELDYAIGLLLADAPPEAASPLRLIDAQTAPTLLIHGDADAVVPIEQSAAAFAALRAAGVESRMRVLPGQDHESVYAPPALARYWDDVLSFIGRAP